MENPLIQEFLEIPEQSGLVFDSGPDAFDKPTGQQIIDLKEGVVNFAH